MAEQMLTAGILGLGGTGRLLLESARQTGQFLIKAVADQDQQQVEKTAAELPCEPYTDYRQMIVQNQLDCLLVAADIHLCDEHLKTAIRKKFHVLDWNLAGLPMANRTFSYSAIWTYSSASS